MSTSRRALLSIMGASVVYVAFSGIASARGGGGGGGGRGGKGAGRDGAMDTGTGIVPATGVNSKQVRSFKIFEGKACRRDYARLCPTKPMGKCDLASEIDQLSPGCRHFVENHR